MGHATLNERPTQRVDAPAAATSRRRLQSLDALRGFVMVIMLIDHLRENWYLYMNVSDPVNPVTVEPALFFMRIFTNLCAPIFVGLTGLGAYLYGQHHTKAETAAYLVKRGLLLMAIDVVLITPAWTVKLPVTFWLQVIWAIGVCMIALAGLIHLPKKLLLVLGLLIVAGHNLLDPIHLQPSEPGFTAWALLHQRDMIALPFGAAARTSYPVLPWIGVIVLGYLLGTWFERDRDGAGRVRRLLMLGVGMLVAFVVLRALNVYGDRPWVAGDSTLHTFMGFIALTKYPPSFLFLLQTLGVGVTLLALFERWQGHPWLNALAVFGGAPMFFYILHMYVLRALYHIAFLIWGPTHGVSFGLDDFNWIWPWYAVLLPVLYVPTAWYSRLKARRRDIAWLKYF
ncbi:putative membrane protein [Pseudoduganella lurida]|uniref:Putative membrane protein n=1 Tax=Pseudoduganella lurida TaxID=1036180 RepID=A0A562RBR3_9BURK|nr:heparan-alpha-glucosaminide N-acetyltransferase domain-containing protein [Pseudoduganella lurida]TWI66353.1 putative membrane protein [Pseudoduganella lurida]